MGVILISSVGAPKHQKKFSAGKEIVPPLIELPLLLIYICEILYLSCRPLIFRVLLSLFTDFYSVVSLSAIIVQFNGCDFKALTLPTNIKSRHKAARPLNMQPR